MQEDQIFTLPAIREGAEPKRQPSLARYAGVPQQGEDGDDGPETDDCDAVEPSVTYTV